MITRTNQADAPRTSTPLPPPPPRHKPSGQEEGVSRRRLLGLGLAAVAVSGCGRIANGIQGDDLPASIDLPKIDVHPTVRLLNRAGFGPKPGQVAEVAKLGHEGYIDQQLKPTDDE